MTTTDQNKLHDTISNNVTKARSLSIVLQAAIEHDSPPTPHHLAYGVWAIADLLGEAESAQDEIVNFEMKEKSQCQL